jgi:hypothetical protein
VMPQRAHAKPDYAQPVALLGVSASGVHVLDQVFGGHGRVRQCGSDVMIIQSLAHQSVSSLQTERVVLTRFMLFQF